MRVLFVEDDPRMGRVYQRLGLLRGYRGEVVTTLHEADVAWRALRPDVIVFDGDLPDGRWADLVELRRDENPATRLVLVTGAPLPAYEVPLLRETDQRFVKPVPQAVLVHSLERSLRAGREPTPATLESRAG